MKTFFPQSRDIPGGCEIAYSHFRLEIAPSPAKPQRQVIDTYLYIKVVSYRCQGFTCGKLSVGMPNPPFMRNLQLGITLCASSASPLVAGRVKPTRWKAFRHCRTARASCATDRSKASSSYPHTRDSSTAGLVLPIFRLCHSFL